MSLQLSGFASLDEVIGAVNTMGKRLDDLALVIRSVQLELANHVKHVEQPAPAQQAQSPVQVEPQHCAEARVIDAASWLMKAGAQLSGFNYEPKSILGELVERLEYGVRMLLAHSKEIASRGATIGTLAHEKMIRHALLNAVGHALYAEQQETAANLLDEYKNVTATQEKHS